ncbi:LINE-1 type transposase domain-containing protein 1 [Bos mutus]|uniref:L1 transposable element RRM domain-containing protein n=1 Tax=Bos mutus grunniens TaxID=30521 RepID=A0A8B9WNZ6_BOSMU
MKNKQTEMNSTLEGIHSRITEADAQINDLWDRMVEITATEQTIEKGMKRNEDSLRDLWDNIKCMNIGIIGVPEAEEREKGPKKTFEEIIVENIPNVGKEIIHQFQEAQKVPGRINPRSTTLRNIIIKLTKIKDKGKILKATRRKQKIIYKGTSIRVSGDFSAETLQASREWHDIFKMMKGKNLQPRILYPARLSFRFDGEIKSFADKQKLREFNTIKSALQQVLKELL